jgi:hypothetical protein
MEKSPPVEAGTVCVFLASKLLGGFALWWRHRALTCQPRPFMPVLYFSDVLPRTSILSRDNCLRSWVAIHRHYLIFSVPLRVNVVGAVQRFVLLVDRSTRPPKMIWVHTTLSTAAARMRRLGFRKWWLAVGQNAHMSVRKRVVAINSRSTVSPFVASIRPEETVWPIIIYMLFKPPLS